MAPGKAADLVVITADPTAIEHAALFDLEVVATIVDGEIGYCRSRDEPLCG